MRDPSGVGEARRTARALAHRLGFAEPDAGRVAIVASELAANVERHGGGGSVLLSGGADHVQVIAVDAGRGIARLSESLRDGHSTGGTPGTGLGAVSRLADEWDVWSAPGRGTAIVARVRRGLAPRHAAPGAGADNGPRAPADACGWRVGAVAVPRAGEPMSGDAVAYAAEPGRLLLLVADGLGHGPDAALAAEAAVRCVFPPSGTAGGPADPSDPSDLVVACWNALRATRGAAVAVVRVDAAAGVVRFAGIGNIVSVVLGAGGRRNLVSMNGTAGQGPARARAFEYPWRAGDTLVAHTDGLGSRWSDAEYGGIAAQDAALLAALLWRDHVRAHDDATVVVLREAAGGGGPA